MVVTIFMRLPYIFNTSTPIESIKARVMLKAPGYATVVVFLQIMASYIFVRLNKDCTKVALPANNLGPGLLYCIAFGYPYGNVDRRETASTMLFVLDF